MEKTTIYLTGELKRRLKARSARTGESEALMIREALTRYLVDEPRPLPMSVGSVHLDLPEGVNSSNIKSWIRENWPKEYWAKRKRHEEELKRQSQRVRRRSG